MSDPDIVAAVTPVVEALEASGARCHIGGSVASSVHGVARATLDVDIVTDLGPTGVHGFVDRLVADYYVEEETVQEAVARRASFNVIHLATMIKVDVFVAKDEPFQRESFARARPDTLEDAPGARVFMISSPEDIILHKLIWHRLGGGVSERQWRDVIGVVRVQGGTLDLGYLRRWAGRLDLADLLEAAIEEAARDQPGP